ncbi:MAG: branched-chain amino acid ABC transporter permease [Actinocatenispora sp.]
MSGGTRSGPAGPATRTEPATSPADATRRSGRPAGGPLRAVLASRWPGYAVLLAILLLVPAVFTRVPFFTMSVAVLMGLQAIAALGLVPLTGHAGQISLGQAAFFAVGGYTSAVLTLRWQVNALLALVLGMVLAAGVAYLVGLFIFRAQGQYLALATLSFGLVVNYLAGQLPITGAANGLPGIPTMAPFGFEISGDLPMYYLVAMVLLVAVIVVDGLLRSPIGKALTALGDSPVATAASGVSIASLRRNAFALAAALAALSGSLYAHWTSYMDAGQAGILNSIQLLIIATIGGLRTVWGAPLGAFVIITISQSSQDLLPRLLPHATGNYEIVVYGLALIVILLFLPHGVGGGLIGLAGRLARAVRGRPPTATR